MFLFATHPLYPTPPHPTPTLTRQVLQNKFDPFHQGDQLNGQGADLVALAARHGIATVGYSTLRGWPLAMSPAEDRRVLAIARNHHHGEAAEGGTGTGTGTGMEEEGKGSAAAAATTTTTTTPAQVLLRWALQSGVAVIPRSADPAHVAENAALLDFELSAAEMATISALETLVESRLSRPRHPVDYFGLAD